MIIAPYIPGHHYDRDGRLPCGWFHCTGREGVPCVNVRNKVTHSAKQSPIPYMYERGYPYITLTFLNNLYRDVDIHSSKVQTCTF